MVNFLTWRMKMSSIAEVVYAKNLIQENKIKEKNSDLFMIAFGSLSVKTREFIQSGSFEELLNSIEKYYIMETENRMRETNLTNIDFNDVERLKNLKEYQDQYLGQKMLFSELKKINTSLKDLKII